MTHDPTRAAPPRAPQPSRWPAACVAGLVLVLGGMLVFTARDTLRPAPSVRVVPVVSPPSTDAPAPSPGDAAPRSTVTVQAPGWLEADPYTTACTALADGVVESIHALEGERVEKGQLVATMVKDDAQLALDRARADRDAANADLATARADLAAAQTDWDNPVQRTRAVDAARAALDETNAELAQLPTLIEAERALLERLNEDYERLVNAERSNAANAFEVVIREKDVARQSAILDAVTQRRAILQARADRLAAELRAAERDSELRIAERRALDDAIAQLASAQARLAAHDARVAEAELRLSRMEIHAPIGGLVQKRLKRPGDKVMLASDMEHSAHIIHIYDPAKLQVRVDVPLIDASHVYVGQRCEVIVDVLPDTTFEGEVTRITHEADLQKNTLQVKVRVIDPPVVLAPEMLTRVKFLPDAPRADASGANPQAPAVLVTTDTLRDRAQKGATVWAVRERRNGAGVARPVPVTILEESGGVAHVLADLRPGALLIAGDTPLTDGQRVRLAKGDAR